MPVVPMRPQPQAQPQAPARPPDVYLMMAAAQMHSENRLVQPAQSDSADRYLMEKPWIPPGHPEWEPQGSGPTFGKADEPIQPDVTEDIMKKLLINRAMATQIGYKT